MPTKPKVWVALNGLELTPKGAEEPVCWPWSHVRIVPRNGFGFVDSTGEKARAPDGGWVSVSSPSMLRDLARTLQARALVGPMGEGKRVIIKCARSDEHIAGVLMLGLGFAGGALSYYKGHAPAEAIFLAAVGLICAAIMIPLALRRNVRQLTISRLGIDADLTDGRAVRIPWRDVRPQDIRGGEVRTVNGLILRYKPAPEIMTAIRAAKGERANYAKSRREFRSLLRRLCILAACLGLGGGAAGAVVVILLGLPPGTQPTPMWVFTRMAGFGVLMGVMLRFHVWLGAWLEARLSPVGLKLHSRAPRAPQTRDPSGPFA